MSDQALATITPEAARTRALKIIEENKSCVSYVRPEDLNTAALFVPVVSVIMPTKDDFYDPIPNIGIMAKPHLVNLLREKAGVNVLRTVTDKRGEYIWIAHVFGNRRQPDGSMLEDDASYEFDAEKRAELDAINSPQKYGTPVAKRRHLLELAKFGEQRAVTGAQHALIHKLAHIPRSFKTPDELTRGMIVLRIDRNVDGLLRDPQMRTAVIQHALGAKDAIYGPGEHDVTPKVGAIEAPQEHESQSEPETFDDLEQPSFAKPAQETPEQTLRRVLKAYLDDPAHGWLDTSGDKTTGRTARQIIQTLIENADSTVEHLQKMADRIAAHDAKAGGTA